MQHKTALRAQQRGLSVWLSGLAVSELSSALHKHLCAAEELNPGVKRWGSKIEAICQILFNEVFLFNWVFVDVEVVVYIPQRTSNRQECAGWLSCVALHELPCAVPPRCLGLSTHTAVLLTPLTVAEDPLYLYITECSFFSYSLCWGQPREAFIEISSPSWSVTGKISCCSQKVLTVYTAKNWVSPACNAAVVGEKM